MPLIYRKKYNVDNIDMRKVNYDLCIQLLDEYKLYDYEMNELYSVLINRVCELENEKLETEDLSKYIKDGGKFNINNTFVIESKNNSSDILTFQKNKLLLYIPSIFLFSSMVIYIYSKYY